MNLSCKYQGSFENDFIAEWDRVTNERFDLCTNEFAIRDSNKKLKELLEIRTFLIQNIYQDSVLIGAKKITIFEKFKDAGGYSCYFIVDGEIKKYVFDSKNERIIRYNQISHDEKKGIASYLESGLSECNCYYKFIGGLEIFVVSKAKTKNMNLINPQIKSLKVAGDSSKTM